MLFTDIHRCFNIIDKSVTKITKAIKYLTTSNYRCASVKNLSTREGFLRKNIVAVSCFFKTVLYTHILNTYLFHN